MATSSNKPKVSRNRKPDDRYVKGDERYRLRDPRYTMAFETKEVQQGFKFSMTPSMEMVKRGQEYRVGPHKLWKRGGTIAAAFKSLLSHFGDHLLQKGGKLGKNLGNMPALTAQPGNSYLYFLHPQVLGSSDNIHCTQCHMPSCAGFSKSFPNGNCPYHIEHDKEAKIWYTMVNLGKDKHGNVVWERAHAILAAARWGIPKAVFDKKLGDKDTPRALHTPCCPQSQGGCLNPLHIHWDLQQQNLVDQQTKKTRQNRGSKAKNLTPVYSLVAD